LLGISWERKEKERERERARERREREREREPKQKNSGIPNILVYFHYEMYIKYIKKQKC